MLIHYCAKCNVRVDEQALVDGTAIKVDGNVYCRKCAAENNLQAPPKSPPAGINIKGVADARAKRSKAVHEEAALAAKKREAKVPVIALLGAASLVIGVGLAVYSQNKPAAPQPQLAATTPESTVTKPSPAPTQQPATQPAKTEHTAPPKTLANDPEFRKLRETNAARRLEEAKSRGNDPWAQRDILNQIVSTYRGTPAALEAEKLLPLIKITDDRPPDFWIRDWAVNKALSKDLISHQGEHYVLRAHPLDAESSIEMKGKFFIAPDKPHLHVTAASHVDGDIDFQVLVNGKELISEPVRGGQWQRFSFDLSPLKGQEAEIILQETTFGGWSMEYLFLLPPRFESQAAGNATVVSFNAPRSSANLIRNHNFEQPANAGWTVTGNVEIVPGLREGQKAVRLGGKSKIEQKILNLTVGARYHFAAYRKAGDDSVATFLIEQSGGTVLHKPQKDKDWGRVSDSFTANSPVATVVISAGERNSGVLVTDVALRPFSQEGVKLFDEKTTVVPSAPVKTPDVAVTPSSRPQETPTAPVDPARQTEAISGNQANYERFSADFQEKLGRGMFAQAAVRVAEAQKSPAIGAFSKQLAFDAELVKAAEELGGMASAGAASLTGGVPFTFKLNSGGKEIAVGKGSSNSVKEVKGTLLTIETDLGAGKASKKYQLDEFTPETRDALTRLALKEAPDRQLKMAVNDFLSVCAASTTQTVKAAGLQLDAALKAKVHPEFIAHLRSRLDVYEKELVAPARLEKIEALIFEKKYKDAQMALEGITNELAGMRVLQKLQPRIDEKIAQLSKLLNPLKPGIVGFYFKTDDPKVCETRVETSTNFEWLEGSPSTAIPKDTFSTRLNGLIRIGTAGNYEFQMTADDAGELTINGTSVMKAGWNEPDKVASIVLSSGDLTLHISHTEAAFGARIIVRWKPPGATQFADIPASVLWHNPDKMAEYQKP